MKSVKVIFFLLFTTATFFSCKKSDPAPSSPAPLSASDAQSTLNSSDTEYLINVSDFQTNTTIASSALSSLSSLGSSNAFSSNLIAKMSSLSSTVSTQLRLESPEQIDLLFDINKEISNISFLNQKNASGRRIPVDFESAKGIWEFQISSVTSSNYNYSENFICSKTLYSNSNTSGGGSTYTTVFFYTDFVKTGSSDKIVIKFPLNYSKSNFNSANCTNLSIVNNAVYTISNLSTSTYNKNVCSITGFINNQNVSAPVSIKDTIVNSLIASLVVDGKEILSYSANINVDKNNYTGNYSYNLKSGEYEYNLSSNISPNNSTGSSSWTKSGKQISGYSVNASFVNDRKIPQINCDNSGNTSNTNSNNSNLDFYKNYKSYSIESTIAPITVKYSIDYQGYTSFLKSKYNIDSIYVRDTTIFFNIIKDSINIDKFFTYELYNLSGSKIGDIKFRYIRNSSYVSSNTSSSGYLIPYIVFSDGTREILYKRTKYFNFYPNLIVYYYRKN
ncbi:MAG: hypothetical protein SFY32_01855 [Bacteroidota bacterium]|nr:hypothetical protein [Bacteroidota bacterium]